MRIFSKPKAKSAPKQNLDKDWEALLKRHSAPLERGAISKGMMPSKKVDPRKPSAVTVIRNFPAPAAPKSIESQIGNASLPPQKVYTGDKMIGVATMHKSNAVPVFSEAEVKEVAQMRRG